MSEANFLTWVLIGVVVCVGGAILLNYILSKRHEDKLLHKREKFNEKRTSSTTLGNSSPTSGSGGRSVSDSRSSFSQNQSTSSNSGGLDPLTTVLLVNAFTQDNDGHSPNQAGVSSYESSKQEPASHTSVPVATSDDSWSGLTSRASNNDRSWSGIEASTDRSSWSNLSSPAVETPSSTPSYSSSSDSGSSGGSSCSSSCSSCGGGGD